MQRSTRNRLDRVNRALMDLSAHVLSHEPAGEEFSDAIERVRDELHDAEYSWGTGSFHFVPPTSPGSQR